MKKIVLIGGGGHCKVIIELIHAIGEYEIVGICDIEQGEVLGVPVIGDDSILKNLLLSGVQYAFVAFGAIGKAHQRKEIAEKLFNMGYILPNLVHPKAYIAASAKMGVGNFIGVYAIVNSDAVLQSHCIINSRATIEHDCHIGDYVHIAPGAIICGGGQIENMVHIGPNAIVLQYNTVASGVVVGAGSVVVKSIAKPHITGYGNPFREIRANA